MVEDVGRDIITDSALFEDVMFVNIGYGIEDSGRAFPVMGETTRDKRVEKCRELNMPDQVVVSKTNRAFKFGNDNVLGAKCEVSIPVVIQGCEKRIGCCMVPGGVPLLLSRGMLAAWGVIQDYRNEKVKFLDDDKTDWRDVEQSENGHFVFNLLSGYAAKRTALILSLIHISEPTRPY